MENQTTPIQPTMPNPQAPVTTPPPIAPMVTPPPLKTGGKNNGLVIVAVILIALIAVLGILYYLIIKQSYQATTQTQTTTTTKTVKPTSTPIPTVTPTDEQILQDNAISDPTKDIAPLEKDASTL